MSLAGEKSLTLTLILLEQESKLSL